jgi:hypothetical protein
VFQKAARWLELDKSLPQEDGKAEKLSQNFDHFFVARLRKMGDYSLGPYAGVALHSDLLSLVLVRAVTHLLKRDSCQIRHTSSKSLGFDKYLSQLCKFDTSEPKFGTGIAGFSWECQNELWWLCRSSTDWQITDWNTRLQQDEAPTFRTRKIIVGKV